MWSLLWMPKSWRRWLLPLLMRGREVGMVCLYCQMVVPVQIGYYDAVIAYYKPYFWALLLLYTSHKYFSNRMCTICDLQDTLIHCLMRPDALQSTGTQSGWPTFTSGLARPQGWRRLAFGSCAAGCRLMPRCASC